MTKQIDKRVYCKENAAEREIIENQAKRIQHERAVVKVAK